jgi:hypothetical protein
MSNYILFGGCSFTWGQGLWSYTPKYLCHPDLHIPTVDEYIEKEFAIPKPAFEFKNHNRFAKLVSGHFNSVPIVKRRNGGSDEETIRFLYEAKQNYVTDESLLERNLEFERVKLIVFQTTQIFRSPFTFFYKNEEYQIKSNPEERNFNLILKINRKSYNLNEYTEEKIEKFDVFYNWLYDNNLNIDDFEKIHISHIVDIIEKCLLDFQNMGIPSIILPWTTEHLTEMNKRNFFQNKIIKLNYKNVEYSSIKQMMDENHELIIRFDKKVIHPSGGDDHPSLECHKILAQNIITFVEKN